MTGFCSFFSWASARAASGIAPRKMASPQEQAYWSPEYGRRLEGMLEPNYQGALPYRSPYSIGAP